MSQYRFVNNLGREVIYGLDKPTGGYFLTELKTDEEMQAEPESTDDVVFSIDGAILSEIVDNLKVRYSFSVDKQVLKELIIGFYKDRGPTPLQRNVSDMFGVNLDILLSIVDQDLVERWGAI